MPWLRWIALGAALTAGSAACGYPTFKYGSSTGSGGTGGQPDTTSTGGGAATTSTTTSSSSSTSSSTSGTGGAPGCDLLGSDCAGDEKCAVINEDNGQTGCIKLSSSLRGIYASCTSDAQCAAGQWCEHRTSVCKPICTSGNDCGGSKCTPGLTTDGFKIAGLSVCVVDCDPVAVSPCGSGATCDYDQSPPIKALDCFRAGSKMHLDTCTEQPECAPSLVCALGSCSNWCAGDSDCPGFELCYAFDSFMPTHDGTQYGWCG